MALERRYSTGFALLLAAVAVLGPAARSAGLDAQQSDLSLDELQRLSHGELVERRMTRERGDLRLMGGTSWQVIKASPDVVWKALLDTPYYPRMLPALSEAKVISETGPTRTLFMRHGTGIAQTSYFLDVKLDHRRREMSFRVDPTRPHGIRAAFGFYTARPYVGGRTLLVYGVMADIGDGLGSALLRGSVHEWMMKVPWMVKRFVEGSGRYLYTRADGVQPVVASATQ